MTRAEQPRLADRLAERIKMMIAARNLAAGARLPAERLLAEELEVSRSSLREALQKLHSEGVLFSRRGGGHFVCDPHQGWSQQRIVEPLRNLVENDPNYRDDILEARHAIEASTAWFAAQRATEADKEKLQACFDAMNDFTKSDSPEMAAQADARFHLAIAEASHNVVLLQTMRGFFDLLQSSVMHSRQRMYTAPAIFSRLTEQHEELLQAILAGDPERARNAAQHHLGFVHRTLKTLHEDEARQRRSRLPDDNSHSEKDLTP